MSLVHEPLEQRLDPERELHKLNLASNKVHNLSQELQEVTEQLGRTRDANGEVSFGAQVRWDIAVEERIEAIVEQYENQDKRPPGYDACLSRAKRYVRTHEPELFVEYMQLLTRQKALRTSIANEKQVISGKQSVLNGLKAIGA